MRVIGTAGHVDHGKSTLVRALTGIDPDRLREEKEREMTIDLGFAWLSLPGGEQVGVIDVPGHIDFIKNMLAGVGGIDAALFVVAADEGVMPQTAEHLAILDLLDVSAGVIALTKTDMVPEEDWIDLVEADLRETLKGTCLAEAPIVRVSARAGTGLEELKQVLADVLSGIAPRSDRGQPRLPIDRVFSVAGFGTVVTGTLSDGAFLLGEEVEIVPAALRARIRTLQTHKHSVQTGLPGSRLAINLTGVHPDQLARGMVVARPGTLRPTTLVDVRLRIVNDSTVSSLKHNQAIDFFSGAAQVTARTRLLDADELHPGHSGWAQLRLDAPVPLVAGDSFILRQPSPSLTIGGGRILNPHPRRRWRRFRAEVLADLEALEQGTPEDLLLFALRAAEPASLKSVADRTNLDADTLEGTITALLEKGELLPFGALQKPLRSAPTTVISLSGWRALTTRMAAELQEYHSQYPLRPGMAREELKSRVQGKDKWAARVFNEFVTRAASEGYLEETDEFLRRPGHRITYTREQQTQVSVLLGAFEKQPYAPPTASECAASTHPDVVSALLYEGQLVRLSEDVLLLRATYDEMREAVVQIIRGNGSVTVAQVRDRFGTSRKYALALMEHLDERKITRRQGDERVLR